MSSIVFIVILFVVVIGAIVLVIVGMRDSYKR